MSTEKKTEKKLFAVIALIALIITALGGTYAFQDYEQHKSNELSGDTLKYDARLVEYFVEKENWKAGELVDKEIYVANVGSAPEYGEVYVRIQLKEFMGLGALSYVHTDRRYMIDTEGYHIVYATKDEADAAVGPGGLYEGHVYEYLTDVVTKTTGYFIETLDGDPNGQMGKYVVTDYSIGELEKVIQSGPDKKAETNHHSHPSDECLYAIHTWDGNELETRQYIEWILSDDVITLSEWLDPSGQYKGAPVPKWVVDDKDDPSQGWVYWGQVLMPGASTSLFMEKVKLTEQPEGSFEYVIHVEMHAISIDELTAGNADWGDAGRTIIRNEKRPDNLSGPGPGGEYYKPIGKPKNMYEIVDEYGEPLSEPPEYIWGGEDTDPGTFDDKPAYPDGSGGYWVEDPEGSNIWKMVDDKGYLVDSPAVWGGEDGRFGGNDDERVTLFDGEYWVNRGQNIWQQYDRENKTGPLGPLTGGGPAGDPQADPVRPVFDNTLRDGRYYIGPMGPDGDGHTYYYGDKTEDGDGKVNSTIDEKHDTDEEYYLVDGEMTIHQPVTVTAVTISPNTNVVVKKGNSQVFTATVLGEGNFSREVSWAVSGFSSGGTDIDEKGELIVAEDEKSESLIVIATAKADNAKYKIVYVSVDKTPEFEITGITVSPSGPVTLETGEIRQFTAIVEGTGDVPRNVTWLVTGNVSGGTAIDMYGFLTIAENEPDGSVLTVKASSGWDPSKNKEATVIVKKKVPPVTDTPDIGSGRILTKEMAGDSSDWVEIATNGGYSLIVRKDYINTHPSYPGDAAFNYTNYGTTNNYKASVVRDKINLWFMGTASGKADKLAENARLREFAVLNNAIDMLGTGESVNGGLTNGFSKPKETKAPKSENVAFALSFSEVASFCSKSYTTMTGGGVANSSSLALNNFKKLNIQQGFSYGMWLRTPGSLATTACALYNDGRAFRYSLVSSDVERGMIHPALWVDSAIFDLE